MKFPQMIRNIIYFSCLTIIVSGCSWIDSMLPGDSNTLYKKSASARPLDVPPDLTQPKRTGSMNLPAAQANTYSAYHGKQNGTQKSGSAAVLKADTGITFKHEGANSWLVINAEKDKVWSRVRDFWLQNGFVLVLDKPEQGLLETDWIDRSIKDKKSNIHRILGGWLDFLYSTGLRDKFRVRIEQGTEAGTVELFLTHKGMRERVLGDDLSSEGTVWETTPSDQSLEAEILKKMIVHLGVTKKRAEQVIAKQKSRPTAQLITDGQQQISLIIEKDFSRAWRLVGLALDRGSFTVIDRNRSKGIYYVKYNDPDRTAKKTGFFSKLKFWGSDDKKKKAVVYQVILNANNTVTRVVVNNEQGLRETSSTAERILKLLLAQLK